MQQACVVCCCGLLTMGRGKGGETAVLGNGLHRHASLAHTTVSDTSEWNVRVAVGKR